MAKKISGIPSTEVYKLEIAILKTTVAQTHRHITDNLKKCCVSISLNKEYIDIVQLKPYLNFKQITSHF